MPQKQHGEAEGCSQLHKCLFVCSIVKIYPVAFKASSEKSLLKFAVTAVVINKVDRVINIGLSVSRSFAVVVAAVRAFTFPVYYGI